MPFREIIGNYKLSDAASQYLALANFWSIMLDFFYKTY
jgi:hypothetical protein